MEQVKSLAKVVVPSVYVVLVWGFTSLKKLNCPNECIRVNIGHNIMIIIHIRSVIIGVFRRIKIFIVILYKLIDLIEVFRIKVITLNAKVSLTDSAKSCTLSALVLAVFA